MPRWSGPGCAAVFFGALTFAAFSAVVVVLWQGGVLLTEGKLTVGELFRFLIYTLMIAGLGQRPGQDSSAAYQESVGAAERVFELIERPSAITDPPSPRALPSPVEGRIGYESVSFRYVDSPDAPWALRDVTLHLAPGEVVALVGPSGAGKTTHSLPAAALLGRHGGQDHPRRPGRA